MNDILPHLSIHEPSPASRSHWTKDPTSGASLAGPRVRALSLRLGLALVWVLSAGLVSCTSGEASVLSAEAIQATVNAIVTASASPHGQSNPTAPFTITLPTSPGWGGEVVRIVPSQTAIEDVH